MRRKSVALIVVAAVVAVIVGFFALDRERPYDSEFDASVPDPAYPEGGPVALYDEGHRNTHTTGGGYKPLADLIRNDGYALRLSHGSLTAAVLEGVGVLAIVLPRGGNDTNDSPAFTGEEVTAVERWVRDGGALLLITDHWPYGPAASALAERFGVRMGGGTVQDPRHHDPVRGDSHLVFSSENGLLQDHPIVVGRRSAERIHRVLTFTGQSVSGPPPAISFLALSDTAVELPPSVPTVDRSGGDVRVTMEYGSPVSVAGSAQGLALEIGRGRIVVLGEAGLLRAQRERSGQRVGMNVPGYDNRQLALNILHWLSRLS